MVQLPTDVLYDPLGDRPSGDLDPLKKNRERMTKLFQTLASRSPVGIATKLLAPTAAELSAKAFKFTQDTFGDISKRISLDKANDYVAARLAGLAPDAIKKQLGGSIDSIKKVLNAAEKEGVVFPSSVGVPGQQAANRQKAVELINFYNANNIFKTNKDIAKEAGFTNEKSISNLKLPIKTKTKFEVNQTSLQNVFNDEVIKGNMKLSDVQFFREYLKKQTGIKTDSSSLSALFKTMPEESMKEITSISKMLRNPKLKRLYDPDMTLADFRSLTKGQSVSPGSFGGLPNRVMNFARRSVNAGNKDIEFLVPPRQTGKSSFDYSDTIFKYKGQTYDMQKLIDTGYKDKNFSQIKNLMDDKTKLLNKKMINPITGEESRYGKVASKAFGRKENSLLQIDHLDIAKNPFSNLRLLPDRINYSEGALKGSADYDPVTLKMGYKFTKDKDKLIKDEIDFVKKVLRGQRLQKDPETGKSITPVEAARKNIATRGVRLERKDGGLVFDPNDYIEHYSDGTKLYKIKSFVRDIARTLP